MRLAAGCLALVLTAVLSAGQGAIGVLFMDDPSPGVLAHFGGVDSGAVVMDAAEGGPAAKAGLRLGDVVVAIDGEPIVTFDDLSKRLGALEPGTQVEITYRRHKEKAEGHHETTVSIEVVDRETFWKAVLAEQEPEQEPGGKPRHFLPTSLSIPGRNVGYRTPARLRAETALRPPRV